MKFLLMFVLSAAVAVAQPVSCDAKGSYICPAVTMAELVRKIEMLEQRLVKLEASVQTKADIPAPVSALYTEPTWTNEPATHKVAHCPVGYTLQRRLTYPSSWSYMAIPTIPTIPTTHTPTATWEDVVELPYRDDAYRCHKDVAK